MRELQNELKRAEQAIARFESRFGMPLVKLEKAGLPANANFETHEAYIMDLVRITLTRLLNQFYTISSKSLAASPAPRKVAYCGGPAPVWSG